MGFEDKKSIVEERSERTNGEQRSETNKLPPLVAENQVGDIIKYGFALMSY